MFKSGKEISTRMYGKYVRKIKPFYYTPRYRWFWYSDEPITCKIGFDRLKVSSVHSEVDITLYTNSEMLKDSFKHNTHKRNRNLRNDWDLNRTIDGFVKFFGAPYANIKKIKVVYDPDLK